MNITGGTNLTGIRIIDKYRVPDAPTIGTATFVAPTSATITYTAPLFNGNATITSYTAVSTPSSFTGTVNQSGSGTITVTGLTPGVNYTFVVYATNSVGNSANSSSTNSIFTSYSYTIFSQARGPLVLNNINGMYTWGSSVYGEGGLGDTIYRSAPVQIPGAWKSASVGGTGITHAGGIKTNGTLWTWGSGQYGSNADGGTTSRSSPAQVGTDTDWLLVHAAENQIYAIKNNKTLWAAGYNLGTLGDNTLTTRSSLVQIPGSWNSVSAGGGSTVAGGGHGIQVDGSLWGWGQNLSYGQVGTTSRSGISSPVQIGTSSWTKVSSGVKHTIAIKIDGTLWLWGDNSTGQLGIGTSTGTRGSPVQLGSDIWIDCCAGDDTCFGIKSNGTLWAWGKNTSGELGFSDTTNKLVPTQVGIATSWRTLASNASRFIAADDNGRIWVATTNNVTGYLGQGDTVNRVGPTLVSLLP